MDPTTGLSLKAASRAHCVRPVLSRQPGPGGWRRSVAGWNKRGLAQAAKCAATLSRSEAQQAQEHLSGEKGVAGRRMTVVGQNAEALANSVQGKVAQG